MEPLNPYLYDRLVKRFRHVRIANNGQPAGIEYFPDRVYREGRLGADVYDWGEVYHINCPICLDGRFRCYLSHRWGMRDPKTRDCMLHLVCCHNESCFRTRERQKQLHGEIFPHGPWAFEIPLVKPVKPTVYVPPVTIQLPRGEKFDTLAENHPGRVYLAGRGFDTDLITRRYGVYFVNSNYGPSPHFGDSRIVIPVYGFSMLGTAVATPVAGWQARSIRPDCDEKKYLNAAGMHKSRLLYSMALARRSPGPLVIVEGVADAWAVGPTAIGIFGKTLSGEQCALISQHFSGRPVVVWLDVDAREEAEDVARAIRGRRVAAGDASPVTIAHMPSGRKDPGECNTDEVKAVIAEALATPA